MKTVSQIGTLLICWAISTGAFSSRAIAASDNTFRFHLLGEPSTLDPTHLTGSDTSYLFSNVFRGLYRYHSKKGLIPEGAKSCTRKTPLKFTCELNTKVRWNDGTPVLASEYVSAFRRFVDPDSKSRTIDLLLTLKNARDINAGKAKPENLGVAAPDEKHLVFDFSETDYDFEFKLSSPSLVPTKKVPSRENPTNGTYNGPYVVKEWQKGKRIILEQNPHYPFGNKNRPSAEALIIEEDSTATTLFETGRLQFQRRLPAIMIPIWETRKEFLLSPLARFDYLGFGPELDPYPTLRKALSYSLDFEEFKKAQRSDIRPGCFGLPKDLVSRTVCMEFNPKKAKEFLAQTPPDALKKKLVFFFSQLGSDSNRFFSEWVQAQWKKHLGLSVEVRSMEQKVFLRELRDNTPPLFKKGVSLDRPSCLAALENLQSGNAENFIRYKNPKFEKLLSEISASAAAGERKKLCTQALEVVIQDFRIVPWGNFASSMLIDRRFTGWDINSLNQLDLSELSIH